MGVRDKDHFQEGLNTQGSDKCKSLVLCTLQWVFNIFSLVGGRKHLTDLIQEDKRQKDKNMQEAAAATEKMRGILGPRISEVQDWPGCRLLGWETDHCLAPIQPKVSECTFVLVEIKLLGCSVEGNQALALTLVQASPKQK